MVAGFLINKEILFSKIGNLSEGQKGLVAFAISFTKTRTFDFR